jgi:hypothetical protein
VILEFSQTTLSTQDIQLQWSSSSTPIEDIEPVTPVGVNMDGLDPLFANMVNGGTRGTWWIAGNTNVNAPEDSNLWPTTDAQILLGEGDTNTEAGGSYLVQFTGMATVSDWPQAVDWVVNGTDLHSSTLQAGQGFNSATDTTTATMVVSPGAVAGFYLTFTNTDRTANTPRTIKAINDPGDNVTVSVSSDGARRPSKWHHQPVCDATHDAGRKHPARRGDALYAVGGRHGLAVFRASPHGPERHDRQPDLQLVRPNARLG